MMNKIFLSLAFVFFITIGSFSALAHKHELHDNQAPIKTTIVNVMDGLDIIQGVGGNIVVLHGDDGVFVIDNGLPDVGPDMMKALQNITQDKPVKMLVNTHWHFDHTGNNKMLSENGTLIIAHDNVRKRLQAGQNITALDKEIPPANKNALPVLTYEEGVKVHLNGQSAIIKKMPSAHTDGDSIVFWEDASVLHTGDIFFSGKFPFIDGSSGGSLTGVLKAIENIFSMVNENTKIIPGHGPLSTKSDLDEYYVMLKDVKQRVEAAKNQNKQREDWIKSKPLVNLKDQWGGGFMSVEKFTEIVWDSL